MVIKTVSRMSTICCFCFVDAIDAEVMGDYGIASRILSNAIQEHQEEAEETEVGSFYRILDFPLAIADVYFICFSSWSGSRSA